VSKKLAEIEKEANFEDILKKSREIVGPIYPVVVDKRTLEIVDGKHRKKADPEWPEIKVEFKSEKEKLLYRIHANLMRRKVSRKERAAQLLELALYLEEEGVPKEKIAQEIVKLVPELSPGYIMNLLPAKYKSEKRRKAGAKGAKARKKKTSATVNVPGLGKVDLEEEKKEREKEEVIKIGFDEPYGAVPIELPKPDPEAIASKIIIEDVIPETGEVISSTVIEPKQHPKPEPKPKTKPRAVKVFPCPRCHVEVETLYCSKCFSELSIREIAKILRKAMKEA